MKTNVELQERYVALHAPCSVEVIRKPLASNKTSRRGSKKGGTR